MAEEITCMAHDYSCKDVAGLLETKDEANKILNDGARNRDIMLERFSTERAEVRYDNIFNSIAHLTEKQMECCCESKVAMAELNGKIDLQTANFENMMLQKELRRKESEDIKRHIDMKFCCTGQFPIIGGQFPPAA